MNADEKNSTSDEKMVLDSSRYANARCTGPIHGDCLNPPIYVCKRCSRPICVQHAEEFVADRPEERWHQYDGYYCQKCIESVAKKYKEERGTEWTRRLKNATEQCFSSMECGKICECTEKDLEDWACDCAGGLASGGCQNF